MSLQLIDIQQPSKRLLGEEQDILRRPIAEQPATEVVYTSLTTEIGLFQSAGTAEASYQTNIVQGILMSTGIVFAPCVETHVLLQRNYVLDNKVDVVNFVRDHQLEWILARAVAALDKAFGNEKIKLLAVVEDDEGSRTLFCFIKFTGSVDVAIAALASFDADWWVRNAGKYAGRLNFDFQLV